MEMIYIFLMTKYLLWAPLLILSAANEVQVEHGMSSIEEQLQYHEDRNNEIIKELELCKSADFNPTFAIDQDKKMINLAFELNDTYKSCFTYFNIILKMKSRKKFKVVDTAKVAFNYDIKKKLSYSFENVSCGSYKVIISGMKNSWQDYITESEYGILNMSNSDCNGISQKPVNLHEDRFELIVLILSVCTVCLILVAGGLACCQYYLGALKSEKEKMKSLEEGKQPLMAKNPKGVKVLILHHYDEATHEKVACLINFLSLIENLKVSVIGDYSHLESMHYPWLIKKLKIPDEEGMINKLILVDSAGEVEVGVNEMEIKNFLFSVKALSNELKNFDNYCKIFVVRFDGHFTNLQELEYISHRVRYRIPDDLKRLCEDLVFGSQIHSHGIDVRRY